MKSVIKPLITEKSSRKAQSSVYAFEVACEMSKHQIQQIVETLYGVQIGTIRTAIRKGKFKRVGKRMLAKKLPSTKIAYITLVKGTIDSFPQS